MSTTPNHKPHCAVETTLRLIGGKWKVLIVYHLLEGPGRFGALRRQLAGISSRTLMKQLRELEDDGIVEREVLSEKPLHVEYTLTPFGQSLEPVLTAMHQWGRQAEPPAHPNPALPWPKDGAATDNAPSVR